MMQQIKKMVPEALMLKLNVLRYRGSRYTCPFCGYTAKRLAPTGFDMPVLTEKKVVGGGLREAACFKCTATDRERLVYIYLKEHTALLEKPEQLSALHIAPEKNLSKFLLQQQLRQYVCGDLFTPGYKYASHVQNMNILNIPYPDNHFRLVICNHVLEHIEEDSKAMKELYRVLQPGGTAILQVPVSTISANTYEDFSITTPEGRANAFGQFDHVRIYGRDYSQRLQQAGFIVNTINISNQYPSLGLHPGEDLYIGSK
ncbi:MAG TPA: methyltransferase domain-containing protein [Ferruginibacter sp.]|nr:methyltransferase domain-containing protein [Ferruginibacter sp.]HMP21994.1 methyltransferase domain-containing protein [Ferruginibacter sp.]